MKTIKLYLSFYKTIIPANFIFSLIMSLGMDISPRYLVNFFLVFLSGGFLFSLGYFEMFKKKEYYFYFNQSVTKTGLRLSSLAINTAIGSLLLILLTYA